MSSDSSQAPLPEADVLLLVAVSDEYQPVIDNIIPDYGTKKWQKFTLRDGRPLSWGEFTRSHDQSPFSLAITYQARMGSPSAAISATTLFNHLKYYCLAMSGVCAGDPEECKPGDLLIAKSVWRWGPGKQEVIYQGITPQVRAKQNFEEKEFSPPLWYEQAKQFGREFAIKAAPSLQSQLPSGELLSLEVKDGHFQTVPHVTLDELIFRKADDVKRKTIAVEMEGFDIAYAAESLELSHSIIVKGVQDYARIPKIDRFRIFAAFASGLFVITFLRHHLPKRQALHAPHSSMDPATPESLHLQHDNDWRYDPVSQLYSHLTHPLQISVTTTSEREDAPWFQSATGRSGHRANAVLLNDNVQERFRVAQDERTGLYLPVPVLNEGKYYVSPRQKEVGSILSSHRLSRSHYEEYFRQSGIRLT